jgi:serine/threonine protein kinase
MARECFENCPNLKSDIFSFGLMLCELLTGNPPFHPDLDKVSVMKEVLVDGFRPDIPDWIAPNVKTIIVDCLNDNPEERPSFTDILWQLKEIGFQITDRVDSVKVEKFVKAVKDREQILGIKIDDFE